MHYLLTSQVLLGGNYSMETLMLIPTTNFPQYEKLPADYIR